VGHPGPPGFGRRQSSGALEARVRAEVRTGLESACGIGGKAAGDCRSPRRCRANMRRAGVPGPKVRPNFGIEGIPRVRMADGRETGIGRSGGMRFCFHLDDLDQDSIN
jgi:hypothetical protein